MCVLLFALYVMRVCCVQFVYDVRGVLYYVGIYMHCIVRAVCVLFYVIVMCLQCMVYCVYV